MKIAITSQGPELADQVDERFGRAQFFIVMDLTSGAWEAVENKHLETAQSAGLLAARLLDQRNVSVVLTGHLGPKAVRALDAAGIQGCTGQSGSVEQAVKQYTQKGAQV